MLCNIGVLVAFVGTKRVQGPYAENANYGTENVRLLEIQVNQLIAFSSINSIALPMWTTLSAGGSGTERSKPSDEKGTVQAFAVQVYNAVCLNDTGRTINGKGSQHPNSLLCHRVKHGIGFDAYAFISYGDRGTDC